MRTRSRGKSLTNRHRPVVDIKFKLGGEAGETIQPQYVVGESVADVPQSSCRQVGDAAEGVDDLAIVADRHRVDGEIATR